MKIDFLDPSLRSLIDEPSSATLTLYRTDDLVTSPVWFRLLGDAFEVVIAEGDRKLDYLRNDPRCILLIFETVRPFRGVEVRSTATIVPDEAALARLAIASRYLGDLDGQAYADVERRQPGYVLRLRATDARAWSLADKLP